MWKDLSYPWQRSTELAFESYKRGTMPIGTVITDYKGDIIAEGRNRIFDRKSANPLAGTLMVHAEITALMQLKNHDHPDIKTYTLYSTLEPCPMCFGAIVMMHIRNVKYAARDNLAGATALNDKLDYIRSKGIIIEKGSDELEAFQLIMLTSFECDRNHTSLKKLLDSWEKADKRAVELGIRLYKEKYFLNAVSNSLHINQIYDEVLYRYLYQ